MGWVLAAGLSGWANTSVCGSQAVCKVAGAALSPCLVPAAAVVPLLPHHLQAAMPPSLLTLSQLPPGEHDVRGHGCRPKLCLTVGVLPLHPLANSYLDDMTPERVDAGGIANVAAAAAKHLQVRAHVCLRGCYQVELRRLDVRGDGLCKHVQGRWPACPSGYQWVSTGGGVWDVHLQAAGLLCTAGCAWSKLMCPAGQRLELTAFFVSLPTLCSASSARLRTCCPCAPPPTLRSGSGE